MRADLLHLASDLAQRGEPFALVTVVRREAPSSARVGNTGLVTAGGVFHGWLGGSCTQPTAVREALAAIRDEAPRLVALRPDPAAAADLPGVTVLPMTCHSGGSVDLYVEPVLPAPRLVVFGTSPTAQAVALMARGLGYAVEAVDPVADQAAFPEADWVVTDLASPDLAHRARRDAARLVIVVATLDDGDEDAIRVALRFEPFYLGVVSSRRRFAAMRQRLAASGIDAKQLETIRSPAGLDIGARTPQEIALSILAEVVQRRRARADAPPAQADDTNTALDPICGMTVDRRTARHRSSHGGREYVFCGAGCKHRFEADPEAVVRSGTAANPDADGPA